MLGGGDGGDARNETQALFISGGRGGCGGQDTHEKVLLIEKADEVIGVVLQ